jgi:hypothetical protein
MKASELNKIAKDAEMKRVLLEFTERLKDDPYQPGVVHPNLCLDDVTELIEDVIYIRGHKELIIKIVPSELDGYVNAEVISRSSQTKGLDED